MMRTTWTACLIGLAAAFLMSPPAISQEQNEWTDLLARDLKDWTRDGVGKNPWRVTADRTLVCSPATDAYYPDREFADGTFEFEYRFRPTERKVGYKANLGVRRLTGGTGCNLALGDDCGTMTATFQGSSDRVKTLEEKPTIAAARAIGEWNEVQVVLKDREVNVQINGKAVMSFSSSDTTKGLIALEAEGSEIEFRRIRWKEAK